MIIRVIGILSKEQKYISLLNLKTETSINIHQILYIHTTETVLSIY